MAGEPGTGPDPRRGDRPSPFWPRFVTWPPAARVVVWFLGWPFVLASRARHQPGTSRTIRVATLVMAVVVGVPWLLTLSVLAAMLAPGEGTGAGFLGGSPDVIFAPLDPATTPPAPAPEASTTAGDVMTVERIVDGDTLVLSGLPERARLIGIDAPELARNGRRADCLGPEASVHLGDLVPPGTDVTVTFDVEQVDDFDRPLVYLHRTVDDLFVNEAMVAGGWASAVAIEPNVANVDRFVAAEGVARAAGRGLWSEACPTS